MTAGNKMRPAAPHAKQASSSNAISREWFENSKAQRISTDNLITDALRAEYPRHHLSVVNPYNCNILSWAYAGHADLVPIDKEQDQSRMRYYIPPMTRLNGPEGTIRDDVNFGQFLLDWNNKEYILYVVDCRDGPENYTSVQNQYILSASEESTNKMVIEAGIWTMDLHGEIYVYDQGRWSKSAELYDSVINASWDDVILNDKTKKSMIADVNNFFDSKDTFDRLHVPWKRGIIYHGPPGNGKTISIKAMMGMLYNRKQPIPTLYVKSLFNVFWGPEESINDIFTRARQTAPCYLVFEDLDSLVSDDVRSFFLNAVDGIQRNDGILMVGSTNHLDRLDPGIVKRPSRFDRKYLFADPDMGERVQYMHYWQGKLDDSDVELPDKMCSAVAKITKGFSFAYMQEAMIASLLIIARDADEYSERTCLECMEMHERPENGSTCDGETARPFKGLFDWVWTVRQTDDEDPDLDNYILWREVKKQVRILREELDTERVSKK